MRRHDPTDKTSDKDEDKDNDNDKDIKGTPSKSNLIDLGPLKHLIRVMRRHEPTNNKKQNTLKEGSLSL